MSESKSLPPSLEVAVEDLAALVHEAWVDNRTKSGWQHGAVRDDAARRSPAMVPYDKLSDTERELDRVTVRRTLEGLRELGYRIELGTPQATAASRDHLLARANRLIARGQPLPAYDVTNRWLERYPQDEEFRLCNARALRRCGALHRALEVLAVRDATTPNASGERRGVVAAVHKELFVRAEHVTKEAIEHLRHAQQLYRDVFEESGGTQYWHGINAATLAFLSGDEDAARALARRVSSACDAAPDATDYWLLATRGEAALIVGRFDVAAAEYRAAVKIGRDRVGDLASTRQNALLLLDAYEPDAADRHAIEAALRPPAVVVFAGLPIDTDGALPARFPAAIEDDVRAALTERLAALDAGFAYSGAAPGAELLFVEAMLERQPSVAHVVLPWPREQFAETHVRAAGARWGKRFAALLGDDTQEPQVQHVMNATLGVGVDSPLYERFAQQLVFGLSKLQAERLATDVVPLVVWDGAGRPGTVSELVERWETQGVRVLPEHVIDLTTFVKRGALPRAAPSRSVTIPAAAPPLAFRSMAILFADVENYSKIPEQRLPNFIEYFVGGIAGRLNLKPYKADNVRRVGDGLLMVFSSVRDAAICALDLVEWVAGHSQAGADGETFWSRVGLPREMRIRVALHAGPVFECVDPLTRVTTFEGAHINYAARIEPVTPGNQVYASEAFAALSASWPARCNEVVCEYVGQTSLAKKFGEYPLYHVRRR